MTPAALHALPQDARKPFDVQGLPSLLVRMIGLRLGVASSAALRRAPTGISTRLGRPPPGPQREHQRQMQMCRRAFKESGLVRCGPNLLGATAAAI